MNEIINFLGEGKLFYGVSAKRDDGVEIIVFHEAKAHENGVFYGAESFITANPESLILTKALSLDEVAMNLI